VSGLIRPVPAGPFASVQRSTTRPSAAASRHHQLPALNSRLSVAFTAVGRYGHGGVGLIGIILIILVVLLLMGRI
jgi:Protein of unknown function (DUF3309)